MKKTVSILDKNRLTQAIAKELVSLVLAGQMIRASSRGTY